MPGLTSEIPSVTPISSLCRGILMFGMNRLFLLVGFLFAAAYPACAGEPVSKDADELARYDARIKPKDRKHWAFQPMRAVAVPAVKDVGWVRNPIDHFILAKLEAQGWKPSPAAEPRTLMRRMYLDML